MKMNKIVLASVMGTVLLTVANPLFASPKEHGKMMRDKSCCCKQMRHHKMWKHMTPDQMKTIKRIKHEAFKSMKPQFQSLRAKRAMLNALLLQPKIDTDKINKLAMEITQIHSQLFLTHVNTLVKIKKETGVNLPLMSHHMKIRMMKMLRHFN